jgi:pimeloyl-ACP methyl ester carboxylesterase
MTSTAPVRPEFIEVDGRLVHLRVAGAGPPIVLMHDSPRSSLLVLPILDVLRERFTVFALDTPGFGYSEPLPQRAPTIENLAEALHRTFGALGLSRAAVYGTHTSSKIALEFATRWPEQASGLVLDGVSVQSPVAQRALLEGDYLKGFRASDDGAHLVGLWLKMRDQFRFFPYNDRSLRARLEWPMPPPEMLQRYLMDLLFAGPDFGRTYGAAFRHDPVPTDIVCRADDVLFSHLERLPRLPETCRVQALPGDEAQWLQEVVARLAAHARSLPTFDRMTPARTGRTHRRYVPSRGGQVHVRVFGRRSRPAVLVLPEIPCVGSTLGDLARVLGTSFQAWLPDLPGCGDSSPVEPAAMPEVLADVAYRLLDTAGLEDLAIYAPAESAALALRIAGRLGSRARHVVLDGCWRPCPAEARAWLEALPRLVPVVAGGHLLEAWHFLRDRQFAFPWFDGRPAAIRRLTPHLDAAQRHEIMVDLFKADTWRDALAAVSALAVDGVPANIAARVSLLRVEDDPAYASAAQLPGSWRRVERPRERGAAWARLLSLLGEDLA